MRISLSNKGMSMLIGGAINMLILSIMATEPLIGPIQHSFAKYTLDENSSTKQTSSQKELLQQAFKDFCFIYYHDGKDKEEDQDTRVCRDQSSAFASLLLDESAKGSENWVIQDSLQDLAVQNLLSTKDKKAPIRSQQDFANSITNADLKALIGGSGNSQKEIPKDQNFLPNLWNFKATSSTSKPDDVQSSSPTPIPPGGFKVTCHFTATALVCVPN